MRLVRLKIGNRFRSLPADFEVIFSSGENSSMINEPICLVGVNGSGKSNVLEAIATIFAFLDLSFLNYLHESVSSATIDQFVIEYLIPISYVTPFITDREIRVSADSEFAHIKIKKLNGLQPKYFLKVGGQDSELNPRQEFLPVRILGYSSGQNELLSIPFKKMIFKYYQSLRIEQNTIYQDYVEHSRLRFMEYEEHSLVLISNYLMQIPSTLEVFGDRLGILELHSFEILINTHFRRNNSVKITSEQSRFMEFLQAACSEQIDVAPESFRLKFIVNAELKARFRENMPDAASLYNALSFLSLLNLNAIPVWRMNNLLRNSEAYHMRFRPSDYEPEKRLFEINNILIRKENIDRPLDYRTLSDGEHQFLYIVGLLLLFKEESSLFLLDEPETHFNPKWKYDYVEIFKGLTRGLKSQVLLTTHDPVLISGLSKENVIVFRRPEGDLERTFRPDKDLRGMGVDAILTSEIFGLNSTLDQATLNQIIDRRKLLVKREGGQITDEENAQLVELSRDLTDIDFNKPFEDPLYKDFIMAIANLDSYKRKDLTQVEIEERSQIAKDIMAALNQRGL